ncbi:MAG: molybdopterin converting factor subunit 1 [Halobacteriovoraceae bacterium]|jgi:molybdopterin converting factor subunit 1|nr:molybdopterin converting factor subunit 1 [Halobacteriovoraceae bacterium]MBT5096058.1 molybdopterin converting factor subunit 1 [Halobacteriovoraceae bacterium]
MQIKVKYFAMLREQTGKKEEQINTDARNPLELYAELSKKYQLKADLKHLMVAINEKYATFDSSICDRDTVVFIPPVAGG